ncbi:MAG: hypothetical protein RBR18_17165 [Desulfovibrionaceae bacterium]|nr:hypothetical protein [Desulfovibrionaceae bacterium]
MNPLRAFNASGEVMEAPIALSLVALLAYIAFQAWAMSRGEAFSPEGFAFSITAILGGGGAVGYGQGYLTRSRAKEREINKAFPGVD